MNWAQCRRDPIKNNVSFFTKVGMDSKYVCWFFFLAMENCVFFSPQWKLWFFLFFPLVKYYSGDTHKNGSQMHQHIRNVFLKLLLGKKREPSAPHSSFLQHCLNKIRLQAPFIVPHRKSSNFLNNDHSLDSTSPCKYNPDTHKCTNWHSIGLKLSSLTTKN